MINDSDDREKTMDDLCVNTIRALSMDAVQRANSGHPGAPMGLATAGYVLWTRILKHNPKNPDWHNRDRFVLSGGHASMLLYSLLHLTGYDLSLNEIKNFRQFGSKTPGHPEYGHTTGVEVTTGPLGQGIANAVGIAIAECHMAARFNRPGYNIVDHYTYVLCGDGDLMEGISSEATSLAGHLGLSKLICIYDNNGISIEGSTKITFTENIVGRFMAYNWHVLQVKNGDDPNSIERALKSAQEEKKKPSIIILETHIAYGSPNFQDSASAHGAPLGEEEICLTKKVLGWPEDKMFFVPKEVISFCTTCCDGGVNAELSWLKLCRSYSRKFPELATQWLNGLTRFMPKNWDSSMPKFENCGFPIATRAVSGKALNAIATKVPSLMGGSADLAPSNKTYIDSSCEFQKDSYDGRNIRFGVRELAMGAIMSGMFIHGGIRPYGGTFLVFSDYMRPAIRMAAIMKLPVIYIFTHDSIAVGEDGPTHQPIEHLAALRTIPKLNVIRPADANETLEAWRIAMLSNSRPTALILSRQKLPIISSDKASKGVKRGAYIISDCDGEAEVLIIATGSEVHISLEAKTILEKSSIKTRVVSMPSWELFEQQPDWYKEQMLPSNIKHRIAVEAGIAMGWERYINNTENFIGIDNFGVSAPGDVIMKKFGFVANNIASKALKMLAR